MATVKQAHVIYHKKNITIEAHFASEHGAKISFTRKGYDADVYAITSSTDFYDNVDKDVEVRNVMNGQLVTIKASQVGSSCDPSTERYWSM